MSDDLEALEEITDQNNFHNNKRAPQGPKRGRVSHHRAASKGSRKAMFARSKAKAENNATDTHLSARDRTPRPPTQPKERQMTKKFPKTIFVKWDKP